MKSKIFLLATWALISLTSTVCAQQKYAVLIGGDPLVTSIPDPDKWNNGMPPGTTVYDEFWNDCYLFWEMLYDHKGYTDENIHILFSNGYDYTFLGQDERYKASLHWLDKITDLKAIRYNITQTFSNLANIVDNDDFLFVWIMSHGGNTNAESDGDSYVYLYGYDPAHPDTCKLYDYELRDMLNAIPAYKKVVFVQAPHSKGFLSKLQGTNTIIYTSCLNTESSFRADNLTNTGSSITENEELEGIIYNHGEFNFHLYSSLVGETPEIGVTTYNGQSLITAPDLNSDNFKSVYEVKQWELGQESLLNETPQYSDYSSIGLYTEFFYPTILWADITNSQTHRGLIGVTKDVEILDGIVTFKNGSIVHFISENEIKANDECTIEIDDNVKLNGTSGNSKLWVDGVINIGENVSFEGDENSNWGGLCLQNDNILSLDYITFKDCYLTLCFIQEININHGNFLRSYISGRPVQINILNTTFNNSKVHLNQVEQVICSVSINNCIFSGPKGNDPGIYLDKYTTFSITNCLIENFNSDGIRIERCGGTYQNLISNTSVRNNNGIGISVFNSYADIHNNQTIDNNITGIRCLNLSNVSIKGNKDALLVSETQRIKNNTINQVYSDDYSFPYYFRFNAIFNETPSHPPLFYFTFDEEPAPKDVTLNYWGENFNPENDLEPTEYYIWEPIWELYGGPPPEGSDEQLYVQAMQNVDNGNYPEAKNILKQLVNYYPESEYSKAALKEMMTIELNSTKDYMSLRDYYLYNQTIQTDTNLQIISSWLANWCDIHNENWPTAIAWFENVIQNPPSIEDSIFAIIDLSYTYFLMQNGGYKSTYTGALPQYKFETYQQYEKNRDDLLALLMPEDNMSKTFRNGLSALQGGQLMQNVPNPFTGRTDIYYKLDNPSDVSIKIYNLVGQMVCEINEVAREAGAYRTIFDATGMPAGMYYYSLHVNGSVTDSKKMLID